MARQYIPRAVQRAVRVRAQERCEYCQSRANFAVTTFAIEHIIPISRGGTNALDNLALACGGCNNFKGDRVELLDPLEGVLVPCYHPRHDVWAEHFRWSADFTRVIGISPTGRATVETLQLNRQGLLNLRRLLYQAGLHPPPDTEPS